MRFRVATEAWALGFGLLALDQATKLWAEAVLQPVFSMPVIEGFFHLTYVRNTGMAFGLFGGNNALFILLVVVLLAVGIWLSRTLDWGKRETCWVAAVLLAGAVGNLIDRVRVGYVIDFLDFDLGFYRWPCFNVADSCITLSAIYIVARSLFFPARTPSPH